MLYLNIDMKTTTLKHVFYIKVFHFIHISIGIYCR